MATAQNLIDETKRHLLSGTREPLNTLAATVDGGGAQDTLTFTYDLGAIKPGALLQVGLEVLHVWSVNEGAKTALCQRAQVGSVAATHAIGDVVTVNPRFPDFAILKSLNDDLSSLSGSLWQVRTTTFAYSPAVAGYGLPADVIDVLEVTSDTPGPDQGFPRIRDFRVVRDAATTDFATGVGLVLYESGWSGQQVRVKYKAHFTPLVNLTDDVLAVTGLPTSAHDIPPLGAAMRLVAPREVKRNFTESQGEPRRAGEVGPGAVLNSSRGLAAIRAQRIGEEAAKLMQRHPPRSR